MKPVAIIGMGLSPADLTARHLKIIETADVLVGGQRLLNYFEKTAARKQPIDRNITNAVEFIQDQMKTQSVVVLASGDPLYFGIGSILINALGAENVTFYPNISSVAAAFARIKEPWSQVQVVSLHGRQNDQSIVQALHEGRTVAAFTDPTHNPAWIAKKLTLADLGQFSMCVLESLGTDVERFGWYQPGQVTEMEFSEPNLVILKPEDGWQTSQKAPFLGMPDHYFLYEKGLITKSEIRAISIAKLQLMPQHVLWDLGAGSGAVAIEASLLLRRGRVIAVEKKSERVDQIKANINHFGISNMQVVQTVLPEGLDELPQPDRIFIGGGGRHLKSIIESAARFLKPDGIVVVNAVLMPSVFAAQDTLDGLGFETAMVQAQISQSRKMPWGDRLQAQNPVWIITGSRKRELGFRNAE